MIYQQSPLHRNLQANAGGLIQAPRKLTAPTPIEQSLPQAINYCADFSGCGIWRMVWPQYLINASHRGVIHSATTMILDERFYQSISCVRLQRQATPIQKQFVEFLKSVSAKNGMRVIYEVDDIVFREDIPDYNKFKAAFTSDEIRKTSEDIMMLCDEITVTCPYMQEYYTKKTNHKKVTVIPNMPPKFWLGDKFNKYKLQKTYQKYCTGKSRKPRVLYAGSGAHFDIDNLNNQQDDFTHVIPAIINNIDKYQWVFIGAMPRGLLPYLKTGQIQFHKWQPIVDLPRFISKLDINCIIAPLQDTIFNRAKSNIKFLEASAHGIPIICQDMVTYKDAHLKFTTGDEMIHQINEVLSSKSKYIRACEDANGAIQHLWLEDNIDAYKEIYTLPYGHKDRTTLSKINSFSS
jgi:glycosyltransferase involved in cell wall biosynthesis